ncbi:class I SAM-dependent methyltransferase Ecym_8221 [Eremothecium cymbalariae DBVPG|uniref:Methyltransferase domain-containing protein n=1 Tax=Eremothecium cymbalariae (strain CBS 270.75 / DBVPG 7215 / KCTC 17166 / NRRL Y-17582) TaxID=931890 RepID=G8JXD2_ERECY|nr:Hypothetical protein Ecym_8221 [Eremothecium cymbalariae DBVPG\
MEELLIDVTRGRVFTFVGVFSLLVGLWMMFVASQRFRNVVIFGWTCFVQPLVDLASGYGTGEQQEKLERFYSRQAGGYDFTREFLLKGREEALRLCIGHLRSRGRERDLVWVDVGAGTGLNVEKMSKMTDLGKTFRAVYLVDLSPSLCEIARARIIKNGWKNVHVVCACACTFSVPEDSVDLITFSYSLSMIPSYFSAIDNVAKVLDPQEGVICSVDFGVQSSPTSTGRVNTLGGMLNRNVPWIYRTFWRVWFEFDKVFLDPSRREYLEYKFGTVKSLNLCNKSLGRIPYYIWLGVDKHKDSRLQRRFNSYEISSPYLAPIGSADSYTSVALPNSVLLENNTKGLPFPSLFYQKEVWRVYYEEYNPLYLQFKDQYIYAFTWEDPREDAKLLNFTSDDTVLAISSAGDNLLAYACLPNAPVKIHGVDLNPCQGHLCELKLAALRSLPYDTVWKLFGEGKVENFRDLLLDRMAPHLSSNAFQYWMKYGEKTFDPNGNGLYDTGFTKWALRLARVLFYVTGITADIEKLCSETCSLEAQKELWNSKIRPILSNRIISKLLIGNPMFLWKALGVPRNQANMINTPILNYIVDTLEPAIQKYSIASDNYFYYLTLKSCYSPTNCPDYVSKKGYEALSKPENSPLDGIRLHTETLNDVCHKLTKSTVTIAVIMDHMDWFDPEGKDIVQEIDALWNVLRENGRILLRSASMRPWYIEKLEQRGFICNAAATRHSGTSIDRVNMYASTWICSKVGSHRMNSLDLKI